MIGTSPLAGMREHRPQPVAIFLGAVGLVFLGVTILLVLQVMRPQAVSFADVQKAKEGGKRSLPQTALCKWQTIVKNQQDLYLPCGVKCLTGLRQSMIAEEITLVALSCATGKACDQASREKLRQAQAARAARLRRCGPRLPWSRRSGSTTRCGTAAAGPPTAGSCAAHRQRRPSSWPSHGRRTDSQPLPGGLSPRPRTTTGAYSPPPGFRERRPLAACRRSGETLRLRWGPADGSRLRIRRQAQVSLAAAATCGAPLRSRAGAWRHARSNEKPSLSRQVGCEAHSARLCR